MASADCSNRIRFSYVSSDEYPRRTSSEIKEDLYILSSPLCRGNAKVESDGSVLYNGEVRPGMMRLASPGERVRTTINSISRAAVLIFPGVELRQIVERHEPRHRQGGPSYIEPLLQPSYQVERLCAALFAAPELDGAHRQLFIDGLAHSLLACLLGTRSPRPRTRSPHGSRGLNDAELERCIEYADSMMAERLDLSAWADVLGMSTTDFARRFRLRTQEAPYAWFLNWRIDRAKQLLRDVRLSVAEIALQVGFCSQSHFTEAFRRRVGASPGRWRAFL